MFYEASGLVHYILGAYLVKYVDDPPSLDVVYLTSTPYHSKAISLQYFILREPDYNTVLNQLHVVQDHLEFTV